VASLRDQLVGHEEVWESLLRLNQNSRLPTGMAFVGPHGVGKRLLAEAFVQLALCSSQDSPCGQCGSCLRVASGSSESLHVVEPSGEFIKVDQIHEVLKKLSLRSLSSKRFVLIDSAEKMNAQSSNALLKILEEPPEGTHFILITPQWSSMLPTIRSRAQSFRFFPLNPSEIIQVTGDSPSWLVNLSRGQVSEVEDWKSEDLSKVMEQVEISLEGLGRGDLEAWSGIFAVVKDRKASLKVSRLLQFFFRDLAFENSPEDQSLPFSDRLREKFSWSRNQMVTAWQKAFELEAAIASNADRTLIFQNYYFEQRSNQERI